MSNDTRLAVRFRGDQWVVSFRERRILQLDHPDGSLDGVLLVSLAEAENRFGLPVPEIREYVQKGYVEALRLGSNTYVVMSRCGQGDELRVAVSVQGTFANDTDRAAETGPYVPTVVDDTLVRPEDVWTPTPEQEAAAVVYAASVEDLTELTGHDDVDEFLDAEAEVVDEAEELAVSGDQEFGRHVAAYPEPERDGTDHKEQFGAATEDELNLTDEPPVVEDDAEPVTAEEETVVAPFDVPNAPDVPSFGVPSAEVPDVLSAAPDLDELEVVIEPVWAPPVPIAPPVEEDPVAGPVLVAPPVEEDWAPPAPIAPPVAAPVPLIAPPVAAIPVPDTPVRSYDDLQPPPPPAPPVAPPA